MTQFNRLMSTLSLVAGLSLSAGTAFADPCSSRGCTVTNTVQVHVGTVLRLSVQGSAAVVATASPAVIASGIHASVGPSAVVRSNGAWRLEISAAQDVWTALDQTARTDKPAADLTWSTRSDEGFSSLSNGPAEAVHGGPTSATNLPLYYRTRFAPGSDTPGSYSMVVRLTLVGA